MEAPNLNYPLVSVCIPLYNAAEFIEEAIVSVLSQTYKNIELIIVDDGSTDNSLGLASVFTSDSRVRVFSKKNGGASAARNECLNKAKGDYIQFLDADDMLSDDKIAEQVSLLLNRSGHVAVCSTVHFCSTNSHLSSKPSPYEEEFLINSEPFHFLLNLYGGFGESGSMVQPNAWLIPRELVEKVGPWDETLSLDDDGEYFCRVLLASKGVLKSGGYNYYRKYPAGNNNVSALNMHKHLLSQYHSLKMKISNLESYGQSSVINKIHAHWLYELMFKAYPFHPDLSKMIRKDIKSLHYKYKPTKPFATFSGKVICTFVGWKIAKRIQLLWSCNAKT